MFGIFDAEHFFMVLAIETATDVCSVALFNAHAALMGVIETRAPKLHGTRLAPMIQELFMHLSITAHDLTAVAVSSGPGSYTGLRIGVALAKGLCMARAIPLIPLPSLQITAAQVQMPAQALQAMILPLFDARRMEVYTALYDAGLNEVTPAFAIEVNEDWVLSIAPTKPLIVVGDGAAKCQSLFTQRPNTWVLPDVVASARGMATLLPQAIHQQQYANLISFEPLYLKEVHTTQPRPSKGLG